MEPWHIIVALIQGLIEWLPISSEGHVVLFVYNVGALPQQEIVTLVVWLHLGTALAVVARYPRTAYELITLRDWQLLRWLIIATMATAITAIPFYIYLKATLTAAQGEFLNAVVGVLLLLTAIVLYLPTRKDANPSGLTTENPDNRISLITGLIQGVSVLPGLSRSGVTVSALLMQKVDKEKALQFSFLMSVPAVLGIFAVEILWGGAALPSVGAIDLILMEVVVFIAGLGSMEFLLRLARRVAFWKLCLTLGLIAIAFGLPALL
ncbi:MAG: undecaprenyl-diphosphate phosphatase [Candidatus Thorarchaeota archaeon]|nr:undecaprenyl-diphosphate phosphatase [Candidatus Thorarchaeota archaeon]